MTERMLVIADILALCEAHGRPMKHGTWTGYVSRNQAPQPDERIGSTPRWRESRIIEWLETGQVT